VRARYLPGAPCWLDLTVPDVDRARSFYHAVFGWELIDSPSGYHTCRLRGRVVGAMAEVCPVSGSAWTTYVATDDVAGVLAAVEREGGRVVVGRTAVPTGERAVVADPAGRVLGLWHSDSSPGSELHDVPGAPCWRATAQTLGAFFGAIFGLVSTVDAAPGRPAYLTVADVGRALSVAVRHGATLLDAARETALGRRAVVADPFGAPIALTEGIDR
jgi:predicted enzyme related to lactoylglutathione lyase